MEAKKMVVLTLYRNKSYKEYVNLKRWNYRNKS